jgi:nucleotide-binding universal stress UspA family protein
MGCLLADQGSNTGATRPVPAFPAGAKNPQGLRPPFAEERPQGLHSREWASRRMAHAMLFKASSFSRSRRCKGCAETEARSTQMGSFRSIICGVDDTPQSMEALRRAASLARAESAKLTLFHAELPPRGEALFAPPAPLVTVSAPPPPEERWCELASGIRGQPVELHYATGDAGARLVEFARAGNADLIVLGSKARNAPAMAIGSVVAKVLVHAPCPVLVVPCPAGSAFPAVGV